MVISKEELKKCISKLESGLGICECVNWMGGCKREKPGCRRGHILDVIDTLKRLVTDKNK